MKILLVTAAYIAMCSGHAFPSVPGDNSHYVEGESRYIWMADGEGKPVLEDLHEPIDEALLTSRNGANNQYWLYTRSNPSNAQILIHGNAKTVWLSDYLGLRPLKVIVHGWKNDGDSAMNPLITSAFLAVLDANVIVVDWRTFANSHYTTASNSVPAVGLALGNFLIWLFNTAGGNWNNVHLVGFSLGAHIVGVAGRHVGGRIARVTGLDPAGPGWADNIHALNRNAGIYVEAIHTDGHILGIFNAVGDADFYPNGGQNPQPGCLFSVCSHGRANLLFAASIRYNHLVGRLCSNLSTAELSTCSGHTFNMGNSIIFKQGDVADADFFTSAVANADAEFRRLTSADADADV